MRDSMMRISVIVIVMLSACYLAAASDDSGDGHPGESGAVDGFDTVEQQTASDDESDPVGVVIDSPKTDDGVVYGDDDGVDGEDGESVPGGSVTESSHSNDGDDDDADGEHGEDGDIDIEEDVWLYQYDPVEVGYVQDVEVEEGMTLQMKTIAVNPPIFEIRNFIRPEECDHIMGLALTRGLFTSQTVPDDVADEEGDDHKPDIAPYFHELDKNGDERLNASELIDAVAQFPSAANVNVTPELVQQLIELKLDRDADGLIDLQEMVLSDTPAMEEEIGRWLVSVAELDEREAMRSEARVSDQAWLDQWTTDDEVLIRLQNRVIGLTLLPSSIIQTSEHLQVVRYKPGGHYHAHYDSSDLDDALECAHTFGIEDENPDSSSDHDKDFSRKRLCRLATVLYYLNDVEEGGETAFPVADNETFTEETLASTPYDIYDLSNHCHKANVVVPPERGKAILWYNHYLDEERGWLGENRNHSLHGGCDVIAGTKWIANNWITVDDKVHRQFLYQKRYFEAQINEPELFDDAREAPEVNTNNYENSEMPTERSDDDGYGSETEHEDARIDDIGVADEDRGVENNRRRPEGRIDTSAEEGLARESDRDSNTSEELSHHKANDKILDIDADSNGLSSTQRNSGSIHASDEL